MLVFICYPKCSTCQKARKWLDEQKVEYVFRDIREDKPTLEELTRWLPMSGLEAKKLFNTSGQLYRSLDIKDRLPSMSAEDVLALLATDGMLVKRPLLVGEDFVLAGFRAERWAEALGIEESANG